MIGNGTGEFAFGTTLMMNCTALSGRVSALINSAFVLTVRFVNVVTLWLVGL